MYLATVYSRSFYSDIEVSLTLHVQHYNVTCTFFQLLLQQKLTHALTKYQCLSGYYCQYQFTERSPV
jgi:hypothetical protein